MNDNDNMINVSFCVCHPFAAAVIGIHMATQWNATHNNNDNNRTMSHRRSIKHKAQTHITHSADNGRTFYWFNNNERKKNPARKTLFIHCILVDRMFSGVLCFLWAWASSDIDTLLPMPYCHIFTIKCDWSSHEFHMEFDPMSNSVRCNIFTMTRHGSLLSRHINRGSNLFIFFSLRSSIYNAITELDSIHFIIGFLEEEKMVKNSPEHQIFVHWRNL